MGKNFPSEGERLEKVHSLKDPDSDRRTRRCCPLSSPLACHPGFGSFWGVSAEAPTVSSCRGQTVGLGRDSEGPPSSPSPAVCTFQIVGGGGAVPARGKPTAPRPDLHWRASRGARCGCPVSPQPLGSRGASRDPGHAWELPAGICPSGEALGRLIQSLMARSSARRGMAGARQGRGVSPPEARA